jgi:hypothetical protein
MKTITNSVYPTLTTLALALACLALSPAWRGKTPEPTKPDAAARAKLNQTYGKLPLSFEANEGQQDHQVKFLSRGSGYNLFLTNRESVLVLTKPEKPATSPAKKATHAALLPKPKGQAAVLRAQLVGANEAAKVTGEQKLPGKVNYLTGKDPSKWRTDVVTYAKVRYEEVYPGVDLVYYGKRGQLEYDFVVQPGADPASIRLRIAGAQKMRLNGKGQLVMKTAGGAVRWNKPEIYQEVDGVQRSVKGKYVLGRGGEVGFQVAAYDTARPLIIDPILVYSTYLGGSSLDDGWGIAVDSTGNAYVTGYTYATDFPTTAGAFQTIYGGGTCDAFVTKLNSSGSGLLYSTYLGGSDVDSGYGIAVDSSGNAYIAGETASTDFPITAGAFQTAYAGGYRDAFVIQLNASGSSLLYSTYLGGSGYDRSAHLGSLALDTSGNVYIVGDTDSSDFPITAGAFQTTFAGGRDVFVAKINATGSSLLYSTYFGGSDLDFGDGIALDSSGNTYLAGTTESFDFPTTGGAFQTTSGGGSSDAFVTKLNATGTGLLYSTYIGGSDSDDGYAIALDASGNTYLTGITTSSDFPITVGAYQATLVASGDAFVTKLNSVGTGLLYSTYLGGNGSEDGWGIAVDDSGNAYVAGFTTSSDFPTTPDAFQTTFGGVTDVFVTQLNATGTGLIYSTYLGGSSSQGPGYEYLRGMALDTSNNVYIVGVTTSDDFPTTPGAFDTTWNFSSDGFVAKIGPPPLPAAPIAELAGNVTATSFTANWDSVTFATGYRLDVSKSSSFASFVTGFQDLDVGGVTGFSVTGLTKNTQYFYRVRAYNSTGTSTNSNVIKTKTRPH